MNEILVAKGVGFSAFTKLISGFILIIAITGIGSFYSLTQMNRLAELTTRVFNNPLRITTAVLSAETNIVRIHRSLDHVALSSTDAEFEENHSSYLENEKDAYDNFKIIGERSLDSEGKALFNEIYELFKKSKLIHEEIVNLAKAGDQPKAISLIKGKGVRHVNLVNSKLRELKDYSSNNATEMLYRSQKTHEIIFKTTALVFVSLVVLCGLFGYVLSRIIAKEINERKRTEIQLKASIEREIEMADIVREAPIAIAFGYPDGKLENCNAAFSTLTGYSISELQQIDWNEVLTPLKWQAFEGEKLSQLSLTQNSVQYEKEYIRKDGSIIPIELTVAAKFDLAGNIDHFTGFISDITERKLAEEKVKASLKEKEILLHEIHHRVKNNMQVISSLLDLQASTIKSKLAKEVLLESQSRVHTMAAVHETLHDSDNLSEIDLQTYLNKVTSAIFQTYSIEPGKINLVNEVEPLPISINQSSPLGLIVNELISNSLKYAFPEDRTGEITISMKKQDDELELTVMDDGVGFPDGMDWRDSNSLGLKLVRSLAEDQLGGSVDMESNNGTKFRIKINIEE